MKKKNLILVGLIAAITLATAGCGGNKADGASNDVAVVEELPTDNEVDISDLPTKDDEADATEQDGTDEADAEDGASIVDVADGSDTETGTSDASAADSDKQYLADMGLPTEGVVDECVDVYGSRWVQYEDGTIYRIDERAVKQYGYKSLDEVRSRRDLSGEVIIEFSDDKTVEEAYEEAGIHVITDFQEVEVTEPLTGTYFH